MTKNKQIRVTWPDGSQTIEDEDFITRESTPEEKQSLEAAEKYYLEHVVDKE